MEKYILKNEKDIYYRINKDLSVENIEPSFVFELIYFNEFDIAEEESKKCVKKKYKKLNRMDLGYREYLLKNLLDYFTHSCNKYMDITDKKQMEYFYSRVSALYVEIYNKKYKNKLEIPKETKLSKIKNIIYNKLKK